MTPFRRPLLPVMPVAAMAAALALVLSACSAGRVESIAPSIDSTTAVPVTESSELPPSDPVAGLRAVQQRVSNCLERPTACDPAAVAVPGSPAHRSFDELRRYYVLNGLVAHLVPELTYVIPERVRTLSAGRVEITLCEVDGSWQMDSRSTASPDDDIVWNDLLVSQIGRAHV